VDVIHKPALGTKQMLQESTALICDAVVAAAGVKAKKKSTDYNLATPKLSADVMLAKPKLDAVLQTTEKIVVVGASTGGTEALRDFLEPCPRTARHSDSSAHARGLHQGLFPAAGQPLPDLG
jgi:two-component system chemotaxis response regulator CheB